MPWLPAWELNELVAPLTPPMSVAGPGGATIVGQDFAAAQAPTGG